VNGVRSRASGGFTLIEVVIALAILAVALIAVLRSGAMATQHVGDIQLRLLADWVAQNRIEEHRARRDWLPQGSQSGEATQAGIPFRWEEKISSTPNSQFRRIDIRVFQAAGPDKDHALAQFTSFLVKPGG
jgi:general secretion pathway protein I